MKQSSQKAFSVKRKIKDNALRFVCLFAATVTLLLLVLLIGYIFYKGLGHISWQLLSTAPSALKGTVGILPNILNTLYIIALSLLIVFPLGIGSAIYLNEYAKSKRLVAVIEFATETLAGIPSIIYGLVGMLFFCQFLKLKTSLISGALTLTIMILPIIIRTTQEALKTVPVAYREGALALGATKWHTLKTVILPSCLDGIITGCILAVGRIVGESAALLFTAGIGTAMANSLAGALSSSAGTLSVALYVYVFERGDFDVGFAIAAILLIIVFTINSITNLINKKFSKKLK
ncbi:MAG: phosphate ABC transporter permease PstA [Oscillospiraceae bacterium]